MSGLRPGNLAGRVLRTPVIRSEPVSRDSGSAVSAVSAESAELSSFGSFLRRNQVSKEKLSF